MSGRFRPLSLICTAALLPAVLSLPLPAAPPKSRAPQPPLPELEPQSSRNPFQLIPKLDENGQPVAPVQGEGDSIPAIDPNSGYDPATDPILRNDPVEQGPDVANMELLQAIDAPGAPSDGEPMPEI